MPHYDRILAHYLMLAKSPAWKAYVWARVQEMAKDHPELYASLPGDLVKAMQSLQQSTKSK